jgi:hypothetical protein
MLEAKRAKQEARNRGESSGDFRGTVQPRRLDAAPADWLEFAFAQIALGLAHDNAERKEQLDWYLLLNRDPTVIDLAIPF